MGILAGVIAFFTVTLTALAADPGAPIGLFDSGTGGFTVLEKILEKPGKGKAPEDFVFVADLANLPYGGYAQQPALLKQILLNNAEFLAAGGPGRPPVKAIVIACNTASACALEPIRTHLREKNLDIPVVGMLQAGANEAIRVTPPGESVGVLATEYTVETQAYAKQIAALEPSKAVRHPVFEHAAQGLAAAIDNLPAYMDPHATSVRARYEGPSLSHPTARIDPKLLPIYHFDFSNHRVLWTGSRDAPSEIQLNSVKNYLSYHLVSLLERMKASGTKDPLGTLILGCTHYPYFRDEIDRELKRLYQVRDSNGEYRYRGILKPSVRLVDPASGVADELEQVLRRLKLEKPKLAVQTESDVRLVITEPNRAYSGARQESAGAFSTTYRAQRAPEAIALDTLFETRGFGSLPLDVQRRLRERLPRVGEALSRSQSHTGCAALIRGMISDLL